MKPYIFVHMMTSVDGRIDWPMVGQLSADEYFVSEAAAKRGVTIVNESDCDPIVMLKHFGPENPDWTAQFGNSF